jgi:nucleotide-binding universal stress UspA family protein
VFKHLLIPTDGSELAASAVAGGIELARALGARVTAYHALEEPEVQGVGDEAFIATRAIQDFEARLRERGEAYLAPVKAAAQAAGVPCETLITNPQTPAEGIVAAAREAGCDAICIASHGRGDIAALLLGSVTHDVLAHAKVPVVVFR